MLVFTSKIPVINEMTKENFISLCSEWVYTSPHYHQIKIEYNLKKEDYEISKENITCQFTHYEDNDSEVVAFRLKNIDDEKIWTLDIIFIIQSGGKFINVQNNLDSQEYHPQMPQNHKPNFIKKLIESGYGKQEDFFKIGDVPLVCDANSVDKCAEYMNGNVNKDIPMVYISKDYDTYEVDTEKLSKWLSGMAYVVIESDKEVSFKLKELTESKNAHNGYIGIYYPGESNYQIYSPFRFEKARIESQIVVIVQQSLINRMSSNEYSWIQIQALKTKRLLNKSSEISKKELDEYVRYADENEKDLKEKIAYYQKENNNLQAQLEKARTQKNTANIQLCTDLQDFYNGEQYDFILSLLRQVKNHIGELNLKNRRQHEILNSFVENNEMVGEGERIMDDLKQIFKPGFKWNSVNIGKLKQLGFSIQDNGHKKIIFHDDKYMYTVSGTPGDARGISNLYGEIERGISVSKKML